MHAAEHRNSQFGALRGGVLGDAPGLGKTITMLALITATAGQRPVSPADFWDEASMVEGWAALRQNPEFRRDLLLTLKPVQAYARKTMHAANALPWKGGEFPTIQHLERAVRSEVADNTRAEPWRRSSLELFRQNMVELRAGLDPRRCTTTHYDCKCCARPPGPSIAPCPPSPHHLTTPQNLTTASQEHGQHATAARPPTTAHHCPPPLTTAHHLPPPQPDF